MAKLNDKALLVQLTISQWTARKYDRKASDDVTTKHNASASAGRFNKALLPGFDALEAVHKKAGYIRTVFYENTLPWGIEGTQLLPSANYFDFTQTFRKEKADWERLINAFLKEYPLMVVQSRARLGTLWNAADYPDATQMGNKFRMDLAVFPVPEADFRVKLGNDEISELERDVERRIGEAQSLALKEVWQRLYDKVSHLTNKLADPSAIFRDSTIENLQELCATLPKLNFMDDPDLEAIRRDVENKLAAYDPDALRVDPDLRRATADEATKIMDKMSVFMGKL